MKEGPLAGRAELRVLLTRITPSTMESSQQGISNPWPGLHGQTFDNDIM